jgi:hypothetical protein
MAGTIMSQTTKLRALYALLAISVAYNAIWVAAANPLIEIVCEGEHERLVFEARIAYQEGRWREAADGFGYLASRAEPQHSACRAPREEQTMLGVPIAVILFRLIREPVPDPTSPQDYRALSEAALRNLRTLPPVPSHIKTES